MNAIISPTVSLLDDALRERAEAVGTRFSSLHVAQTDRAQLVDRLQRPASPIVKTALHGEAEIVGTYDGQNIYRLMSNGQYYALEVGCYETIEEVAEQIDMWRAGFRG